MVTKSIVFVLLLSHTIRGEIHRRTLGNIVLGNGPEGMINAGKNPTHSKKIREESSTIININNSNSNSNSNKISGASSNGHTVSDTYHGVKMTSSIMADTGSREHDDNLNTTSHFKDDDRQLPNIDDCRGYCAEPNSDEVKTYQETEETKITNEPNSLGCTIIFKHANIPPKASIQFWSTTSDPYGNATTHTTTSNAAFYDTSCFSNNCAANVGTIKFLAQCRVHIQVTCRRQNLQASHHFCQALIQAQCQAKNLALTLAHSLATNIMQALLHPNPHLDVPVLFPLQTHQLIRVNHLQQALVQSQFYSLCKPINSSE
eukprot:jgi/Psemu1/6607/gm1.6607_g